jgi:hypothetical protein
MRRDKAVLDDKGVLRRVPRGARVWIDNLPSQARPSASQQGHISNALGRKGSSLWCITRLVEIDAAAAGCPQHRMDSPAAWSSLAALQTA